MKISALLLLSGLAGLLGMPLPASATTTVTVGNDGACDYDSISRAALLAPGSDTLYIHLARNVLVGGPNVIAGARDVIIEGGYDTCTTPTPSGRTLIDASGVTGSFLWFTRGYDGSGHVNVRVANLEIINGSGSSSVRGGAITINGPFWVTLWNTSIHDNSSGHDGGGIYVKGEAGVATGSDRTYLGLFLNSLVSSNTADSGGGIACEGKATVTSLNSQIGANLATDHGGGVSSQNCRIIIGENSGFQGVVSNQATASNSQGGGIYADGGSVLIIANRSKPSTISLNRADAGGGVFIANGTLQALDASITQNVAASRGGGIYATNSEVTVARMRAGANCHAALRCSELSGNRVLSTAAGAGGGGLYAVGGRALISGAFVESNSAASGNGLAVLVYAAPGTNGGIDGDGLRIYASVVAQNGASASYTGTEASLVSVIDTAFRVSFNTFVDNASVPRLIHTSIAGAESYTGGISGNIFANSSGVITDSATHNGFPGGACNDVGTNTGPFAQNSTRSTPGGYVFVDAPSRDYRLAANSSDIDFCNVYAPSFVVSADGGPRPYDDPDHLPVYGNYDLGGLERHPDDLIFRNGVD